MALIIAGRIYVDPEQRDRFVAGYRELVARAREYPGCLDVSISPDPIEPGRVNMVEHWESRTALDAWRKVAPRPRGGVKFRDAQVQLHEIASSGPPFG